jgi:hypothetical protein
MQNGDYLLAGKFAASAEDRYPEHSVTEVMTFKAAFAQGLISSNDPFAQGFKCVLDEPVPSLAEIKAWQDVPTSRSNAPTNR